MLLFDSQYASKQLSNFESNMILPRHRWYEFKEGFTASLVKEAILSVETDGCRKIRVFDPFGGSGTTSVVAASSGHLGQSLEVNPFLAYVGKCKSTKVTWSKKQFKESKLRLLEAGPVKVSPLEGVSTLSESSWTGKWLFNQEVLRTHASLMRTTEGMPTGLQQLMKLAVIAATMDVCNAKRDGKCLRYRKKWKEIGFNRGHLIEALNYRLDQIEEDIAVEPLTGKPRPLFWRGDCRQILPKIKSDSVDLVVTSPPYLNSFDYSDVIDQNYT